MSSDPVAVLALGLAAAAVIVVVVTTLGLRRALEARSEALAREQTEALRWAGEQVTATVDRFHGHLVELERRLAADHGAAGADLQRTVSEQLQGVAATVAGQLAASQKALGDGLTGATEVFGRVQGQLGQVAEVATRMERLAASVDELGSILKVPKLRGLLGERSLEVLLGEVLPPRLWAAQHRFSDGRVVDAVVRLGDRLLPIDAKFPLEAYRRLVEATDEPARRTARRELERAVKGRIDEIAGRYLRPDEGTLPLALMYIPAEGVWGEVVAGEGSESLVDYGLARRVVAVSPATLYAYLTTVAIALRGLDVSSDATEVLRSLAALETELERFREEFTTVGRHLHNAVLRFAAAQTRLDAVEVRLRRAGRLDDADDAKESDDDG